MPAEKMSLRPSSWSSPRACSGDMKSGEPVTVPSAVSCTPPSAPSSEAGLARPKSSSLATSNTPPRYAQKMLAGLMSRWTSPMP